MVKSNIGPGTQIKKVLAAWGITDKQGCGCTQLANEMDLEGADKIESNITSWVTKVSDSIKKWRGIARQESGVPIPQPPELAIKLLIQYGIKKSRELQDLSA